MVLDSSSELRGTVNEKMKIKRADALRLEGRMRRGRQRLGWEGCVKRDLVGLEWGEERGWRRQ